MKKNNIRNIVDGYVLRTISVVNVAIGIYLFALFPYLYVKGIIVANIASMMAFMILLMIGLVHIIVGVNGVKGNKKALSQSVKLSKLSVIVSMVAMLHFVGDGRTKIGLGIPGYFIAAAVLLDGQLKRKMKGII